MNKQVKYIHYYTIQNKRIRILWMHVFVGNHVVDAARLEPPHSETGGSEDSDDDLEDVRELTKDELVQEAMTQLPTVSSVDYDVRDVDTQEDDLVTKFMTSGCGCSQFSGKECSIQFTNEHVSQARGRCLELSHNELDIVLLGQLQAFSISEDQHSTASYQMRKELL